MASPGEVPTPIGPPLDPWSALVRRSLDAWGEPNRKRLPVAEEFLRSYANLDGFLSRSGGQLELMFWFFQRRESFMSQKRMTRWSRDRLDDYVLFPAFNGFVTRAEFFFASHFWQTKDDPDPGGKYLRLFQGDLEGQSWSYIWVDWTCVPQHPRTENEERYFIHSLRSMPCIIRNSAFIWFYPPFEPRLWILYEVAEYALTCDPPDGVSATAFIKNFEDMSGFSAHIDEMLRDGVRPTLSRHGYRCTYDRDKEFLTSWIEVLVLLRKLGVDVAIVRRLLDSLTWHPVTQEALMETPDGLLKFYRFNGELFLNGERHKFTPFPKWEDGKFGMNARSSST